MNFSNIISSLKDATIKDVFVGIKTTAVISSYNNELTCGISTTINDICKDSTISVIGKNVKEVSNLIINGVGFEKSIAMAAINSALYDIPAKKINATEFILKKSINKKTAVIGHFPFVEDLKKITSQLKVSELNPKDISDITPQEMENFLPQSDIIIITGLTLLNNTFEKIISLSNPKSLKILLGPSVPLHPYLFNYVDILSGVRVYDIKLILEDIKAGKSFKNLRGKEYITAIKEGINL